MRLIDADKVLERLQEWNTSDKMDKALYNFARNRIVEQPTAYNRDKVVEQLENRSELARPVGWSKAYEIIMLKGAIEIVKEGGTE